MVIAIFIVGFSALIYLLVGFMCADLLNDSTDADLEGLNQWLGVAVIWPLFAVVYSTLGMVWLVKNVRPGLGRAFELLIKGD